LKTKSIEGGQYVEVIEYDIDSPLGAMDEGLIIADVIYHLAEVNRRYPKSHL